MRKLAAVLFAFMIVLAGCSGGGTTAAPTDADSGDDPDEDAMDTTADGDDSDSGTDESDGDDGMDGDGDSSDGDSGDGDDSDSSGGDDGMDGDDSDSSDGDDGMDGDDGDSSDSDDGDDSTQADASDLREALTNEEGESSNPLQDASSIEMTIFNASDTVDVLIQNDTENGRELLELSTADSTDSYYATEEYVAVRNTSTGEVQYGEPDSNIGFGLQFGTAIFFAVGLGYIGAVEWQDATTTPVDNGVAYESSTLNQTYLDQTGDQQFGPSVDGNEVQSVDGRIVASDGMIHTVDIKLETSQGTYGVEATFTYDSITIEKPGWVDESQAP